MATHDTVTTARVEAVKGTERQSRIVFSQPLAGANRLGRREYLDQSESLEAWGD